MNGRPSAVMIGQDDGDGRCGGSDCPAGVVNGRGSATFTRRWFSSSAYLRCHHSSSWCTTGVSSKFHTGGGDDVAHSSERPSHGSASAGGVLRVTMMLYANTRNDAPIMKAPIVSIMFQKFQPMPSV